MGFTASIFPAKWCSYSIKGRDEKKKIRACLQGTTYTCATLHLFCFPASRCQQPQLLSVRGWDEVLSKWRHLPLWPMIKNVSGNSVASDSKCDRHSLVQLWAGIARSRSLPGGVQRQRETFRSLWSIVLWWLLPDSRTERELDVAFLSPREQRKPFRCIASLLEKLHRACVGDGKQPSRMVLYNENRCGRYIYTYSG